MFKALFISLLLPMCAPVYTPSPTAVEKVNSMSYSYGVAAPALEAYRLVAEDRGWSANAIAAWEPFVNDIIVKESGYCPNLRRGARLANGGVGCAISRQGTGSDSGFGQVIGMHYRPPKGWLCAQEGLCSSDQIIGTPWASMTALVAMVERNGRQPWCYNAHARRYHRCGIAPTVLPLRMP